MHVALESITVHPDYNSTTWDNDIAVLRFAQTIVMNDIIRPICLPTTVEEFNMVLYINYFDRLQENICNIFKQYLTITNNVKATFAQVVFCFIYMHAETLVCAGLHLLMLINGTPIL